MATRFAITTALIAYLLTAVTHADEQEQEVRQSLAERYRADAKRIIDATLAGNDSYRKLEELCDDIGARLSGSAALEKAVAWAVKLPVPAHRRV